MAPRSRTTQQYADAAIEAFGQFAQSPEARCCIQAISAALQTPGTERQGPGSRLPVCSYLSTALAVETPHASLQNLKARFMCIEPLLEWRAIPNPDDTASPDFVDGHANAMIIGPGGLEERNDLWLGVSLLAPNVRYPDHNHPPEEVYLVLSEGEFRQGEGAWFSPGIGGSFYNVPYIKHAMRSADTPLFAFWALSVVDTVPFQ